ncbi:PfkB family carbohydrate kinase [Halopelagius longus]|uniref:PfkB family carbohydrate kinase n=1 Tax=Halopelagius longus TaxID=1236180 RepID=UPI0011139078|nr:PfkB family carbohydrate kinase [Halopelagius longus]
MTPPYENVAARLSDLDPVSVCCLPDGSVDDHYELDAGDERVASREGFARAVEGGEGSLRRRRVAREPGGQAVNAARQTAALGDDATLFGHLDHAVFERLDPAVETVSFGSPSEVDVLRLAESDLMLVTESDELESWSGAVLRSDRSLAALYDADAVYVGNWASAPGLAAAFDTMAEELTDSLVVVDPGPLGHLPDERIEGLFDALRAVSESNDAVLSLNDRELGVLASYADGATNESAEADDAEGASAGDRSDSDDDAARLAGLRESTSLRLAVLHDADRAVAAGAGDGEGGDAEVTAVPNAETDRVETTTGAGDRFSAGLARALAAGWPAEESLALGNLCATYRVATGGTGTATELRAFADAAFG